MNIPLSKSIASCVVIHGFGRTLQPRIPVYSSLPLTVLGHTLTFDVKVHCFKICVELSFLFESEILSNTLFARKDVFLSHPDRPLSTIEFCFRNLFKVLTIVERSHGTLAAICRIE